MNAKTLRRAAQTAVAATILALGLPLAATAADVQFGAGIATAERFRAADNGSADVQIKRGTGDATAIVTPAAVEGLVAERLAPIGRVAEKLAPIGYTADKLAPIGRVAEKLAPIGHTADKLAPIGRVAEKLAPIGHTADKLAPIGRVAQ